MPENTQDLARRLDSLERQNRRLKRGGFVVGLGIAALALQSFASPSVCDVVSAERIVLRNSRGRARMVLDAYSSQQPSLTFNDAKGKPSMRLQVSENGNLDLSVFRKGKQAPATLKIDGSQLGLAEFLTGSKQQASESSGKTQGID